MGVPQSPKVLLQKESPQDVCEAAWEAAGEIAETIRSVGIIFELRWKMETT